MKKYVHLACLIVVVCLPSIALAQLRAEIVGDGFVNPLSAIQDPAIPGV